MIKKIIAGLCMISLIVCQMVFILPEETEAATAGETLEVRVGYWGDDKDYRVKAELSRASLESLPQELNYYTNMTRVGTIMSTVGQGPTISSVLSAAGIDVGSVRMIHLRTNDASGKTNNWFIDFSPGKYIGSTLYYYPNLVEHWQRVGDQRGKPLEGALEGKKRVNSILAIQSHSTKVAAEGKELDPSMMNMKDSYRLCAGQSPLQEMVETSAFSAHESAKWIYGIDITLWGKAGDATGLKLKLTDPNLMVGSTKRISAQIQGQELFENVVNKKLAWKSSNKEIATVDQKGNVTVKKKGKVTITATTANGISKSVTINGTADPKDVQGQGATGDSKGSGDSGTSGDKKGMAASGKKDAKKISQMKVKEVLIGNKMDGPKENRPEMAEEAVELTEEENDPKFMFLAGYTAILIFGFGIVLRVKRYFREV